MGAPVARLPRRVVEGACLLAVVLLVAFWVTWFGDRDLVASEHRSAYVTFENAFPLADGWMALASFVAFVSSRRRRPAALVWFVAAGSAAAFLTGMDVLYDLENGIYAKGGPAFIEIAINLLTAAFAVLVPTWAWQNRQLLLNGDQRAGSSRR